MIWIFRTVILQHLLVCNRVNKDDILVSNKPELCYRLNEEMWFNPMIFFAKLESFWRVICFKSI